MSYLLKVLFDGKEIVYRDLLVNEELSLFDLHTAILNAFKLGSDQMAAFTKVDEDLGIEVDYQIEAFDENSTLMKDVKAKDVFTDSGDLLVYTYDFLNEVTFGVELIEKTTQEIVGIKQMKSYGNLPADLMKQVDPNDAESILIQAMLGDEDIDDEDDDLFNDDNFESLDDYEDLY